MAGFFIGLLSVLLGIVSVLIVLIVLMQRPKQEGLGAAFGGGMTDQMFGAQTTNVLQKGTVYLAVMFFVFSLALSVLTAKSVRSDIKAVEDIENEADTNPEPTPAPSPPAGGSTATTPPVSVPVKPVDPANVVDPEAGTTTPGAGTSTPGAGTTTPEKPAEPTTPVEATTPAEASGEAGDATPTPPENE